MQKTEPQMQGHTNSYGNRKGRMQKNNNHNIWTDVLKWQMCIILSKTAFRYIQEPRKNAKKNWIVMNLKSTVNF